MIGTILGFVLNLLGGNVLDKSLGYLERKADSETERERIAADRDKNASDNARAVITTGMGHRAFWIPWLMAAVPLAAWFGWGVLDSAIYNGTVLPDVAALPPQLKEYADIVWGNLFYAGGGVVAAGLIARGLAKR